MTTILVAAVIAVLVGWWIWKRRPSSPPSRQAKISPPPTSAPAPKATVVEVAVRRPVLPSGEDVKIVEALRRGDDPDEEWMRGTPSNDGLVRLMPYEGRFQSVVGETFANPNGVSRQDVLARSTPGCEAYLIPEPSNQHDPDAVAVYIDTGNGDTAQIGYLPKNHSHGGDIAAGKVLAWLARVSARKKGAPLGAVLYIVTQNT